MIKLLKACNKLKETLSANKETPFFVENLHDGFDLRSKITRAQFEEMNKELFD